MYVTQISAPVVVAGAMKEFTLNLIDAPTSRDAEAGTEMVVPTPMLFCPEFKNPKWAPAQEFASWFGYAVLMAEGLHAELFLALTWIHQWRQLRERRPFLSDEELRRLKFEDSIHEFSRIFNQTHRDTREFVRSLHRARKLRNKILHQVFNKERIHYFLDAGGCAKRIEELKHFTSFLFPIIPVVTKLGRWHAADCGWTKEVSDAFVAQKLHDLEEARRAAEDATGNGDDEQTDDRE